MGSGASKKKEKITYLNGTPQFEGKPKNVIKCFENKSNGLLFRLESKPKKKIVTWVFYNDTKEYDFNIKMTFNRGAEVEALGRTELSEEPGLGGSQTVAETRIKPGETLPFVKGRLDGFRCRYEAYRATDGAHEPM